MLAGQPAASAESIWGLRVLFWKMGVLGTVRERTEGGSHAGHTLRTGDRSSSLTESRDWTQVLLCPGRPPQLGAAWGHGAKSIMGKGQGTE